LERLSALFRFPPSPAVSAFRFPPILVYVFPVGLWADQDSTCDLCYGGANYVYLEKALSYRDRVETVLGDVVVMRPVAKARTGIAAARTWRARFCGRIGAMMRTRLWRHSRGSGSMFPAWCAIGDAYRWRCSRSMASCNGHVAESLLRSLQQWSSGKK
jgi:hypothetical protein